MRLRLLFPALWLVLGDCIRGVTSHSYRLYAVYPTSSKSEVKSVYNYPVLQPFIIFTRLSHAERFAVEPCVINFLIMLRTVDIKAVSYYVKCTSFVSKNCT